MKKSLTAALVAVCLLLGCGKGSDGTDGSGKSYRDDVSAQALVEAVASELAEDYWPDTTLAPEYLEELYGVSSELYEEYYGQTPMISANVDTLIVVKAQSEQKEKVEQSLKTYQEAMIQDSLQYPMNIPKIQASIIRTFGDYVCFVQLGGSMEGMEDDEEAAVKACQEMNEKALSVIEGKLTE